MKSLFPIFLISLILLTLGIAAQTDSFFCKTSDDCPIGKCESGNEYQRFECVNNNCYELNYFADPCQFNKNTICGNSVCENGEADIIDCPKCYNNEPACMAACKLTPGTCLKDCGEINNNNNNESNYSSASWECYDGTAKEQTLDICVSFESLRKSAEEMCENKCRDKKCGVSSFTIIDNCPNREENNKKNEDLCSENTQDCCKEWAQKNNILKPSCVGSWSYLDGQCTFQCSKKESKITDLKNQRKVLNKKLINKMKDYSSKKAVRLKKSFSKLLRKN